VASAAIEALATAGDGEHAETLFEALSHPDPEVVKVALAALARTEGDGATTGLATCLVHVAPEVRRLAAELLGQVGGVEARSLLKARLDRERDPGVQAAITRALGRGGNR
jgi:HEAT repeat protein